MLALKILGLFFLWLVALYWAYWYSILYTLDKEADDE